ncbi:ribosome maturation factor RimP [Bryobacter aggregatus]|uniref:ribosome maturation factor RimP n=1 Tax=Bryobacter aggregatus TaxID=360054 RepID=UPI0004E1D05A|nr:ribosome maturation factor RimP [Bryobacter aggregatus]
MKSISSDRIQEIAEQVAQAAGLELVEARLLGGGKHRVVRLFIDKPEGVTHDDCQAVSHQMGDLLDAEEVLGDGAYTLEVSSPGVDRPLLKPKDYERFLGKKAKIQLREAIEKRKTFDGKLTAFDGERVTLEVAPDQTMVIALADIDKANLKYEW